MNLTDKKSLQLTSPHQSYTERVWVQCQRAKELEESGNYEMAREAMSGLWERVGQHPRLDNLDNFTAAEVLLRVGVLSGFIGRTQQIQGAQEIAKNLINESVRRFEELEKTEKIAEARTCLAYCYLREGAYDEARVTLHEALAILGNSTSEQHAITLLHSAIVEATTTRFNDALHFLTQAAPSFEASSVASKGRFHMQRGIVFECLSNGEHREDYADRALLEYTAASFHFEQAGHLRNRARVENNLGVLYYKAQRFAQAHEHLERARSLFASLNDGSGLAQVDDTRARTLLAEGYITEADQIIRRAVQTLETGDEQALLAEALCTHGTILARLHKFEHSLTVLQRAFNIAERVGDLEGAGKVELTIIEELLERLTPEEAQEAYATADQLLRKSQEPALLERMRVCARRVLAAVQGGQRERVTAPGFVYASDQTAGLLRLARELARRPGPVLLTGETGVGKELLARSMHEWSDRTGAFVTVNCAALSDALLESQLFGHLKGSFTDAVQDNLGAVRAAAGGTLFLDEVAELSLASQGKLLRFLERGEIHTVGAARAESVDVRVVAATNRNLEAEIAAGRCRTDFYYRLQTFQLELPPLRARPEDIPALAAHFIAEATARYGKRVSFAPEAIAAMCRLPLKGNARELRALVERTMLAAEGDSVIGPAAVEVIALRQTQKADFTDPWAGFSLKEEVRQFEERLIEQALRDAEGKVSQAARLLGFRHHETLSWRLKNRNKQLLTARKPAKPRKRSIIKHHAPKRG